MKEKNASVLDFKNCAIIDEAVKMSELGRNVFDAKKGDCVIVRMAERTAFCDFVKRHHSASTGQHKLSAFQVTVSDQHSISLQGLENLLIYSGHLQKVGDTIEKSENADHIEKVSMYWVVPPARLEYWRKKVPKKIRKTTSKLLKECLYNYVEQFVLVMDVVPNQVKSVSGQVDVEDQGPQTDITKASNGAVQDELKKKSEEVVNRADEQALKEAIKAQCASIGVQRRGSIETLQKRLELVEYKRPREVDDLTENKLDVYTVDALKILCDDLGLSNADGKPAIVQRLLAYAECKSLKSFASLKMLDKEVTITNDT